MTNWPVHGRIDGPIVMIGFGSIGKGTLPLIERHFDFDKSRFVVIDPDDKDRKLLDERGIRFIHEAVTKDNYRQLLTPLLTAGRRPGLLRQPVGRHLLGRHHGAVQRHRRALHRHRQRALGRLLLQRQARTGGSARTTRCARPRWPPSASASPAATTAVSCCGANPGMVSWFVKQALLEHRQGHQARPSRSRRPARTGRRLAMKARRQGHPHRRARHPARASSRSRTNVFVNTWSVEGFLSEGMQPAELGWGTHEKWMPANGRTHKTGCQAAIYLLQPGANTRVRSWTPTAQAQYGFLVTHNESISIADYFTLRSGGKTATGRPATTPITRPTTRCCRCTSCSARPEAAGRDPHPGRARDRRRHR